MEQQTRIGCMWKYRRNGLFYYRGELTINGTTTEVFMIPVLDESDEMQDEPALEVHTMLASAHRITEKRR
jgi:hypothetical protein